VKQQHEANRNMKRKLQIIISASAASVLAFSALAQDQPNPTRDGPDYTRDRMPHAQRPNSLNDAAKASDLIGMTVKNYQSEKLGKVEDLAVDVESGRVVQVILSTGGILGIGDTLTAVPPGALHHDVANKVLHLDADPAKLKAAPKFEMSKWGECCDSNHLSGIYHQYGQSPAFTFIQSGDAVPDATPNTVSSPKAADTLDKDRISSKRQCMIPVSCLSPMPFRDSHRYQRMYKSISGVLSEICTCTFSSSTPLTWGCETILSCRWLPLGLCLQS
jgi:hypothetical protein